MKNNGAKPVTPEVVEKSGSVFAQLGRADADDLLRKARVMNVINAEIKRRGLTQEAAAEVAGIDQADMSRLANGRVSRFSLDRLMAIVDRLELDISIEQRRDEDGHLAVQVRDLTAARARAGPSIEPRAESVRYDAKARQVVLELRGGATLALPVRAIDELANASDAELSQLRAGFGGRAVVLDDRDIDVSVAGLLRDLSGIPASASS